jgi:quercetin dioxygenase-like cupin family protein
MKVIKVVDVKVSDEKSDLFTGKVDRQPLTSDEITGVKRTDGSIVIGKNTFHPGARTKLHTHKCEQFLYITDGKGTVGTDKEQYDVTPGTLVYIPAGELHFHGATETTSMGHLTIVPVPYDTKF